MGWDSALTMTEAEPGVSSSSLGGKSFSQDLGFSWDTDVFPEAWGAILAKSRVWTAYWPKVTSFALMTPAAGGSCCIQGVPAEIQRRGQGKTCSRAMGWAVAALGKAGSDGEPQLGCSAEGQRGGWKRSLAFQFFISTKRRQSWARRGMTAVQPPIAAQSCSRCWADGFVASPALSNVCRSLKHTLLWFKLGKDFLEKL